MDWEKNVSRAANVDAVCQLRAFDPSTSSICLRILAARSSIGLSLHALPPAIRGIRRRSRRRKTSPPHPGPLPPRGHQRAASKSPDEPLEDMLRRLAKKRKEGEEEIKTRSGRNASRPIAGTCSYAHACATQQQPPPQPQPRRRLTALGDEIRMCNTNGLSGWGWNTESYHDMTGSVFRVPVLLQLLALGEFLGSNQAVLPRAWGCMHLTEDVINATTTTTTIIDTISPQSKLSFVNHKQ